MSAKPNVRKEESREIGYEKFRIFLKDFLIVVLISSLVE